MSTDEYLSKESANIPESAFFDYFYSEESPPTSLWKPLKEKYRNYKQISYNTPKPSLQISFIKKFSTCCAYLPFLEQNSTEKIEITLIQETIESIYNQQQEFFCRGGWRVVKNKSLVTHLQEHLLLKLWRVHSGGKLQGGIGKLVIGFFYTLNYYKSCNYEIRQFNEFLLGNELEALFIFILLRKKSRRVNKDLIVRSEHIASFVRVLKGEKESPSMASYSSEHEELGEVKLLLIYPEIMEYIKTHEVVLHEILLYSLMKCVGLLSDLSIQQQCSEIDWNKFFALYFKEVAQGEQDYRQELIKRVVKANMKMADSLFKLQPNSSTFSENVERKEPRQSFLEESFGWLIGVLQSIIYGRKECNQRWRGIYCQLQMLFEEGLPLGNKLVEQLLKSEDYYRIYCKHQSKGNTDDGLIAT